MCVGFDLVRRSIGHQFSAEQLAALPYYATLTQSWFYDVIAQGR